MLDYFGSHATEDEQIAACRALMPYVLPKLNETDYWIVRGAFDAGEPYEALDWMFALMPNTSGIPHTALIQAYECLCDETQDEFKHLIIEATQTDNNKYDQNVTISH